MFFEFEGSSEISEESQTVASYRSPMYFSTNRGENTRMPGQLLTIDHRALRYGDPLRRG
ncbi:MAG: hypothetical protein ACKVT0_05210 [Planctomycetaceae bacterium]